MERVEDDSIQYWCPDFADVIVGREAAKGLVTASEIVGGDVDAVVIQEGLDLVPYSLKQALKDFRGRTSVSSTLSWATEILGFGRCPQLHQANRRENSSPDSFLILFIPRQSVLPQRLCDRKVHAAKVADQVTLELLPLRLFALDVRQTGDATPLQALMQDQAGPM